ncbi:hypothetical protein FACS189432_02550 [Bacteroidia bacterium]|nr:hypothetical protein FACS189426_00610 [Bacteroidia bacterium]GHT26997.1 hypothetical protein FACS189432_02550 [Bacteroidia bacterium]
MNKYPLAAGGLKYSLTFVVPDIIQWYVKDYEINENIAMDRLYNSTLYEQLENDKTALWHLSPRVLSSMLHEEITTGKITYPEEAL